MARPITIRIDVTKIDKAHLYQGKNGAKYLNLAIFENRDGPGKYGDTHYVVQDLPKEARDAGAKGAILGNAKIESGTSRSSPPDRNFSRPPEPERSNTSGSTYRGRGAYVPPEDTGDGIDF